MTNDEIATTYRAPSTVTELVKQPMGDWIKNDHAYIGSNKIDLVRYGKDGQLPDKLRDTPMGLALTSILAFFYCSNIGSATIQTDKQRSVVDYFAPDLIGGSANKVQLLTRLAYAQALEKDGQLSTGKQLLYEEWVKLLCVTDPNNDSQRYYLNDMWSDVEAAVQCKNEKAVPLPWTKLKAWPFDPVGDRKQKAEKWNKENTSVLSVRHSIDRAYDGDAIDKILAELEENRLKKFKQDLLPKRACVIF